MSKFIDRTGGRYGRWTAVNYVGSSTWSCICECGSTRVVPSRDLVAGKSKSCGCLQRELTGDTKRTHGGSSSRAYQIWVHMRGRCRNPKNERYALYGGRGIDICSRWDSFANFISDMGEPPANLSIDRVDNDRGYYPDNCRWATQKQQVHNSRSTKLSDDDVRSIRADNRPLKVIAKEYGVTHTYICNLRNGRIRPI